MENKTGKYFKYAIGEIILVVIGILIALQINNWNENRNQQQNLNNIYATIKTDLLEDIKNIDRIISETASLEKDYLAIINKTRKKEDFKNCEFCWLVNLGYSDIKLRNNGINLLLDFNKLNNNSNDSLTIALKNLYNRPVLDIETDMRELRNTNDDYLKTILSNKPWFPELTNAIITDDFIEYALTDIEYRNYATMNHFVLFKKFIPHLKQYKSKGLELISLLNKRIPND
jgi:hypothetical protein